MRRPCAAGLAILLAALAGCALITGGTDGYRLPNAGPSGCVSAADCGDGGSVCCFSANASAAAMAVVGQCAATCGVPQLCALPAECSPGEACTLQSCDGGGVAFSAMLCGAMCAPVVGFGGD